jgi:hypothetical protein
MATGSASTTSDALEARDQKIKVSRGKVKPFPIEENFSNRCNEPSSISTVVVLTYDR